MSRRRRILITGGAGFIGVWCADSFARRGWGVTVLDNFSRPGTELNIRWLRREGKPIRVIRADVRNGPLLKRLFRRNRFDAVLHLAAQVAVTTSLQDPVEDFEVNLSGTLKLLEALRLSSQRPLFLFASTNKVYGDLEQLRFRASARRWSAPKGYRGVSEQAPVLPVTPYGCSKAAADQYTLDYARCFEIPAVCFRQSCIYGERQFGVEDQGWVAWFFIAAQLGHPITIYGDGRQVRDLLYVGDLVRAFARALQRPRKTAGQAYNLGGGSGNTLSLLELLDWIRKRKGIRPSVSFAKPRRGDQKWFVCNIAKARAELAWTPRVGLGEGLNRSWDWIEQNQSRIRRVLSQARLRSAKESTGRLQGSSW